MITGVWNFIKRHKKKFIFSGFLFGGSWLMFKYVEKKIRELRQDEDKDYMTVIRRQHHFESNQKTCNMTVLSMIPNIREILVKKINTEDLTTGLKQNPSNKLELWGQLKIYSFARSISSVYGCCLMSLTLRVQLNVIGGYIFLDSSHDSQNGYVPRKLRTSMAVQERYLSLIKHFVGPGFEQIIDVILMASSKELDSLSLRDQLTLENVQSLIQHVRDRVERENSLSILPLSSYLLPAEQLPDIELVNPEDQLYDKLITETRDVLDSSDFQEIVKKCLDRGFSKLFDYIADHYKRISSEKTDMHEVTIPLAKLVPIVNSLLYKTAADAPNSFIQELLLIEEVRQLAGNIYEAFSQGDGQNCKH